MQISAWSYRTWPAPGQCPARVPGWLYWLSVSRLPVPLFPALHPGRAIFCVANRLDNVLGVQDKQQRLLGQTQLFQLLQAFQKSSHFHFVIGGAQTAGTISKLLALPQAWRNGLVGDSIPALITELCLLLIQLELSLLMIAAELITLINLTYSYFEFNT